MGQWQVSADTLAESRFVLSPLAEATASMMVLDQGVAMHPGDRDWLAAHLPAYRARLKSDPVTAQLIQAALHGGHNWLADFLTPVPSGEETLDEELTLIRRTRPESARAHLRVSLQGPIPDPLKNRSDLPERAADLLEWVWAETVRPSWARRRRVLEADIVARTGQLSRGGLAAALDDMRPGMRWLGEGRLQINAYNYPPRDISGKQMLFVPVTPATPRAGWVAWDARHRYAVIYSCSGALAEPGPEAVPEALGRLLGPARAAVLVLLGTPMSTTQLVALTSQKLGSVGRHLKVLYDARLVERRRSGRSVLYYRTAAGDTLVESQRG